MRRASTLLALGVLAVTLTAATGDVAYGPHWWAPGDGRTFPAQADYTNAEGDLRVLLEFGAI